MFNFISNGNEKLSIGHAFLWILVSTLIVSGTALMGKLYYLHLLERRLHDEHYRIASLVQVNEQATALKTNYLAELLDLSIDRPLNLYQFNVKEGEKNLKASPLIKHAFIRKVRPGTLLVHYELREPVAFFGNLTNTLIDEKGVLFPYQPFFQLTDLPIFYLDHTDENLKWGDSIREKESFKLALAVLVNFKQLFDLPFNLKQLDVMQADSESYGKRQIIALIENAIADNHSSIYLRLDPENYKKNLNHLMILLNEGVFKEKQPVMTTIDLRIPSLAFIKTKS